MYVYIVIIISQYMILCMYVQYTHMVYHMRYEVHTCKQITASVCVYVYVHVHVYMYQYVHRYICTACMSNRCVCAVCI